MIQIQEFKASLGDEAKKLTEEQILKLRDQMNQEAEIFFTMWLEKIMPHARLNAYAIYSHGYNFVV